MRSHEVQTIQSTQRSASKPTSRDLEPHRIKSIDPLKINKEGGTVYLCKSNEGKKWLLYPPLPQYQLTYRKGLHPLNGAREILNRNQRFDADAEAIDENHTDTLLFLAANANQLTSIIFYKPDIPLPKQQNTSVFTEVDMRFNTHKSNTSALRGQADLIFELPDYQLGIIEVGSGSVRKKLEQGAKQYSGLKALLKDANHGQVNPISLFVAKYQISNSERSIIFHPGKSDEISVYEGMEVFNSKKRK